MAIVGQDNQLPGDRSPFPDDSVLGRLQRGNYQATDEDLEELRKLAKIGNRAERRAAGRYLKKHGVKPPEATPKAPIVNPAEDDVAPPPVMKQSPRPVAPAQAAAAKPAAPPRTAPPKPAPPKAAPQKAAPQKAAAKPAPAKKAAAKKAAPKKAAAKKSAPKKAAAKKAPAKKSAPKKSGSKKTAAKTSTKRRGSANSSHLHEFA